MDLVVAAYGLCDEFRKREMDKCIIGFQVCVPRPQSSCVSVVFHACVCSGEPDIVVIYVLV